MADRHADNQHKEDPGAGELGRNRTDERTRAEDDAQDQMRRIILQTGTTLLETLVAMAFFAIVSSALFMLFAGTSRQFSYTTKTVGLQTDLAGALNIFLDDVSLTGFSGYTANAYTSLATANSTGGSDTRTVLDPATALPSITLNFAANGNPPDSIQFIADISSSTGIPDGSPDRVTYQVTGNDLTRTIELGDGGGG